MKIYLATTLDNEYRDDMYNALNTLRENGHSVYAPVEHRIDHAWEYTNSEWGMMVFTSDVEAIKDSDCVVMISYGRYSSAGANWEAGYAFGIGKKVIVVEMTDNPMSLMVANGRYATIRGLDGLKKYKWDDMPKLRTDTEQK